LDGGGFGGAAVHVSNTGDTAAGSFAMFLTFDFQFPFSPLAFVTTISGLDGQGVTDANFLSGAGSQE
jgi:hypothetical protein